MCDVNANKAVLVSRKGFSGTAQKKAKRKGISLCIAHDALGNPDVLSDVGLKVPVVFRKVEDVSAVLRMEFVARRGGDLFRTRVNPKDRGEASYNEMFRKALISGEIEFTDKKGVQRWKPDNIFSDCSFKYDDGTNVDCDEFYVDITLTGVSIQFGYMNSIPKSKGMLNITDGKYDFYCSVDNIMEIEHCEGFVKLGSMEEVPKVGGVLLDCIQLPKLGSLMKHRIREI